VLLALIALALQASSPPPPPACESAEHKQFDFWVGEWDVFRSDTNQLVARSLIEKLYGGCAIRENWMPLNGFGAGGSLNSYRPEEKHWRQVYTGSANGWADYVGGIMGKAMVIEGTQIMPTGKATPVKITYEPGADGSVVQTGYQSADGRVTWQVNYQFVYRPAAAPGK
jgi:hypothetical protein